MGSERGPPDGGYPAERLVRVDFGSSGWAANLINAPLGKTADSSGLEMGSRRQALAGELRAPGVSNGGIHGDAALAPRLAQEAGYEITGGNFGCPGHGMSQFRKRRVVGKEPAGRRSRL